ncbi:hypothetical protein B0H14DRAFT_156968 [Mycena olivaceomarginata]|nr:hypothetical protein B0H14DRAFT_156968 [Mycena olivaceomarginata]
MPFSQRVGTVGLRLEITPLSTSAPALFFRDLVRQGSMTTGVASQYFRVRIFALFPRILLPLVIRYTPGRGKLFSTTVSSSLGLILDVLLFCLVSRSRYLFSTAMRASPSDGAA